MVDRWGKVCHHENMSKQIWILGIGFLVVGLWLFPRKVMALAPRLDLSAKDGGDKIIVDIYLYPHNQAVSGIETSLKFDDQVLKFKDFQAEKLLPVVIMKPEINDGDKIHLALGINPNDKGVRESGRVAELTFEKLADEASELKTEGTIITVLNKDTNMAQGEAEVEIGGGKRVAQTRLKLSFWQKLIMWFKSLFGNH